MLMGNYFICFIPGALWETPMQIYNFITIPFKFSLFYFIFSLPTCLLNFSCLNFLFFLILIGIGHSLIRSIYYSGSEIINQNLSGTGPLERGPKSTVRPIQKCSVVGSSPLGPDSPSLRPATL